MITECIKKIRIEFHDKFGSNLDILVATKSVSIIWESVYDFFGY